MPSPTFFALPPEKRARIVDEAIAVFSESSFHQASLSELVRRLGISKGSIYQYFEDKLDLYRWLLIDEVPRQKKHFMETSAGSSPRDFWKQLEQHIELGMAFLVAHPRLARLTAFSADPTADAAIRGLHTAVCEQGFDELKELLKAGIASGDLPPKTNLAMATSVASAVIGPGLTDIILRELDAEMHEVLANTSLRDRLDRRMRRRLAKQSVAFLKDGLGR
ncbi:MAG: hypothetical protein Tsb0020_23590 [Haliangiales bacterium]